MEKEFEGRLMEVECEKLDRELAECGEAVREAEKALDAAEKEVKKAMDQELETRIRDLDREIAGFRQAISDAEGALDAAEKELSAALAEWDKKNRG